MRIAVFGATGMAGSATVAEALTRGHSVLALSRRPGAEPDRPECRSRAIDIADRQAVDSLLAEVDAAVLAVRLPPGQESAVAGLTRGVLDAAARRGTRVLVIGGSAPLHSPGDPDRLLIDDPAYVPAAWRSVAAASLEQFRVCREHAFDDWVYLSPPTVFEPGERSGRYQRGTTTLLTDAHGRSRITAPDCAIAVVDELEHPREDRHFTVVGPE